MQQIFSELLRLQKKEKLPSGFWQILSIPYSLQGNDGFGQETESQESVWSPALAGVMKRCGTRARWPSWLGVKMGQPLLKLLRCFQKMYSFVFLLYEIMKIPKNIWEMFVLKC